MNDKQHVHQVKLVIITGSAHGIEPYVARSLSEGEPSILINYAAESSDANAAALRNELLPSHA
ncbi:hypothetical protein FOXG_22449 [Fusarium oxysporum f. sp. lycopersici 4287]|uniref:Uncharacterized protein n=1 Tax=Fusarium oxysporum f. sp. lycopersici (strain 4287 / CBS 123668 / FGSC 9935 / NRRL 34936) TaxID=426428 RepID=A0A0J9V0V6_FUSO4|nr:hypothetical protein FOXG_19258 [Fusarium oxysporum f. sp. lycopersici 4287]XP_018242823.1 hypothetical protein FOXG_19400 [Fusarium oxysporum f. sp. lycopersici 4287]XP_018244742.1 hypothetical protein FOXG_19761 [Fusarium oxysporum f. sp. lycopersici 4287]XP_018257043.1 uncharacterized protein FOXG_22449 [Fusarium oxysporum f. sp. lycopersici 4287]KNB04294.1 hypothetical protein FOXG_19258 [Fusarium oxysporum f. sp. lycopersici 4287]KNB04778.1 hypothetical protein FOXG_19400 [Fusarium oxy